MKNIIFDLGEVMVSWKPQSVVKNFTTDVELQEKILKEFFNHSDWLDFDCGIISEQQAIARAAGKFSLSEQRAGELFEQAKASLLLIPETGELLSRVKEKNLKAFCLSNTSVEFYDYMRARYEVFGKFDGAVISAEEKMGKPDPRIYEILLQRYDLNPRETLFIDDKPENTQAAEALGISTVTFRGSEECYQSIYDYIK